MKFDRALGGIGLGALALAALLAWAEPLPVRDLAGRYAPMAEALAAGDWANGFHPAYPPLQMLLASVPVRLFGVSGETGNRLIAILFFALALFPLYGIFRAVWNRRIALWGTALYAVCDELLSLAAAGVRDSGRSLFVFLGVWGLLRFLDRRDWTGALTVGAAAAGLGLLRGDCFAVALALGLALLGMALYDGKRWRFPGKALAAGALALLALSPWLGWQYRTIGYPVADWRQANILARLNRSWPRVSNPGEYARRPPVLSAPDRSGVPGSPAAPAPGIAPGAWKTVGAVFGGLYPPYLLLVAFGMALRLRGRVWSRGETVLAAAVLLHLVLVMAQIRFSSGFFYVSDRYLLPVAPLGFGWAAVALETLWQGAAKFRNGRAALTALLVLGGALLVLNAFRQTTDFNRSKRRAQIRNFRNASSAAATGPAGAVVCDDSRLGRLSGREFWLTGHAGGDLDSFARKNGVTQLLFKETAAPGGWKSVETFGTVQLYRRENRE